MAAAVEREGVKITHLHYPSRPLVRGVRIEVPGETTQEDWWKLCDWNAALPTIGDRVAELLRKSEWTS